MASTSRGGDQGFGGQYDYTEGASAIDIDTALANNRRLRRDSQYSIPYGGDGEGTMFDGPGHSVNPTSVSRMSYSEHGLAGKRSLSGEWSRRRSRDNLASEGRANLSRRSSGDSQVFHSEDDEREDDSANEDHHEGTHRRRRKSSSPQPRTSVFENLAHLFGRTPADEPPQRRPSLSQRSSTSSRNSRSRRRLSDASSGGILRADEEREERWGYSSGEEDNDEDSLMANDDDSTRMGMGYDSYPPSPTVSLPLLSSDPIFGDEARIDMDGIMDTLDPPPPGPPSRQVIYVPDEDSTIRFIGYETILWRQWLWRFGCICTVGILGLLGHWFPRLWLRWVANERAFQDLKHGFVVVEVCPLHLSV